MKNKTNNTINTINNKKKGSLFSKGLSLSILTLFSRILGLLREMTKARFLGTSAFADAFSVAFLIPNLFRRLFAENTISVAFIPTFRGYLEDCATDSSVAGDRAKKQTKDFINSVFTLVTFCSACVVILGVIFAPFITPFFCDTKDMAIVKETTLLTRIMFPYLFVITVAAFFQGILNGLKIFNPSGFTPILFNAIVITFTIIFCRYTQNPARAMSIGVITGGAVQAVFQLPFVAKTKFTPAFCSLLKALKNPGTKKVVLLIVPTIVGMAAYQLNDAVSTALAAKAGVGIVSSLQYSLRLQELILGIFAVTIGTVILPDMSAMSKKQQWQDFCDILATAIKAIALICLPVTFFAFLCGKEIICLVFKAKSFDATSVILTLSAFKFHILGLFFIALNRVISPAFYAQGNTKSPAFCGILSFAANIILAFLLVGRFKGSGIAFALSASSFFNTVFLFYFLLKDKRLDIKSLLKSTSLYSLKMLIFSGLATVPTYFVHSYMTKTFANFSRLLAYGLPLLISLAVFASVGLCLLFLNHDSLLKTILRSRQKIAKP